MKLFTFTHEEHSCILYDVIITDEQILSDEWYLHHSMKTLPEAEKLVYELEVKLLLPNDDFEKTPTFTTVTENCFIIVHDYHYYFDFNVSQSTFLFEMPLDNNESLRQFAHKIHEFLDTKQQELSSNKRSLRKFIPGINAFKK